MRPRVFLAAMVVMTAPQPSHAQTLVIDGSVRDSVTATPVAHVSVCFWTVPQMIARCTRTDSAGVFRLDSLRADSGYVNAYCELLPRGLRHVFKRDFPRPPADPLRIVVASAGCDTRLERHMTGIFAGHYSVGFEQSAFIPCPQQAWYIPSDTVNVLDFRRNAWLDWSHGRETPGYRRKWPKSKSVDPPWNYPQYYIRFVGRIDGPGSYGHLGVAGFAATVDSLIDVRTPIDRDCERYRVR